MTVTVKLSVNGQQRTVIEDPGTPLLWVLRDSLGLTGTKYGCGIGACGACTVHVNGGAARACILPIEALEGAEITTIEGLGARSLHPVQQAWMEFQVAQCGYCQSGVIMTVADLLARYPQAGSEDLESLVSNLCRCGSYPRMRLALQSLVAARGGEP